MKHDSASTACQFLQMVRIRRRGNDKSSNIGDGIIWRPWSSEAAVSALAPGCTGTVAFASPAAGDALGAVWDVEEAGRSSAGAGSDAPAFKPRRNLTRKLSRSNSNSEKSFSRISWMSSRSSSMFTETSEAEVRRRRRRGSAEPRSAETVPGALASSALIL